MISHELRTPIHGLAGSLEMLRLDDLDKTSTLAVGELRNPFKQPQALTVSPAKDRKSVV